MSSKRTLSDARKPKFTRTLPDAGKPEFITINWLLSRTVSSTSQKCSSLLSNYSQKRSWKLLLM